MKLNPPKFWYQDKPGLAAGLLSPLAGLVGGYASRRQSQSGYKASIPVICVGNLTVGGTGKTPTALYLARLVRAKGLRPHFLSRGYGGKETGPLRVDPNRHLAKDVGDEPLLLAAHGPAWIAADRAEGAKAIEQIKGDGGADVIIMDDGFQNPGLQKDISLLVMDATTGLGNGKVMPAGPLREQAADGFARADGVMIIGDEEDAQACAEKWLSVGLNWTHGSLQAGPENLWLAGQKLVAFAGIGRPQKFYDTLTQLGGEVVATHDFPDHHPYKPQDMILLMRDVERTGGVLVTTEKDAVRLPLSARGRVTIVRVDLEVKDSDQIHEWLSPLFGKDVS